MNNALTQYRALPTAARLAYNPSGKHGAAQVRGLQKIAALIAAVKNEGAQVDGLFRAAGYEMPKLERAVQALHTIPLGAADESTAKLSARVGHPRRQNWGAPMPSIAPQVAGATIDETFAYSGKFKCRIGYTYHPTMQSAARISNDGLLMSAIVGYIDNREHYTIPAGRGYRWAIDANGICIVRLADGADYHPSSDKIRAGRGAIIAALRRCAETRKKTSADAKRDAKILAAACEAGVWVCLADSIAAGNCETGTETYARRHGLDIRRHYRAESLLANGDSRRIALAVLAAQRRQVRDMARGYAEI
jgi:hypothetical protein